MRNAKTTHSTKEYIKLFIKKIREIYGKSYSVNLIRTIIEKYHQHAKNLDEEFLIHALYHQDQTIIPRLWELTILDRLSKNPAIIISPHKEAGPDWTIQINNKEYCIEATCPQLLNTNNIKINSVLNNKKTHIVYDDILGEFQSTSIQTDHTLIPSVKAKISSVISAKVEKHRSLMNSQHQDCGYILCVSYSAIPRVASCDLYHAIATILPIGPISFIVEPDGAKLDQNLYMPYEDSYIKPSSDLEAKIPNPDIKIPTNLFENDANNWISAILFSKAPVISLLEKEGESIEHIWNGVNNDFVLVHNPKARHPLDVDPFDCRTILSIHENQLVQKGQPIFPSFV
jgi:hypothetical protein